MASSWFDKSKANVVVERIYLFEKSERAKEKHWNGKNQSLGVMISIWSVCVFEQLTRYVRLLLCLLDQWLIGSERREEKFVPRRLLQSRTMTAATYVCVRGIERTVVCVVCSHTSYRHIIIEFWYWSWQFLFRFFVNLFTRWKADRFFISLFFHQNFLIVSLADTYLLLVGIVSHREVERSVKKCRHFNEIVRRISCPKLTNSNEKLIARRRM